MGIIQTADQLRFCYRAVIKAADTLLGMSVDQRPFAKVNPTYLYLSTIIFIPKSSNESLPSIRFYGNLSVNTFKRILK